MQPARLAILVSGRGRNLRALQAACTDGRINAKVVGVISNDASAPALDFARHAGMEALAIPHRDHASRKAFDEALAEKLRELQPDIIALAGFMRVLGEGFVAGFSERMLNIHPSLLPRYPGLHTHRRALAAGDAEHGATVHFVTGELDGGPRILQGVVPVRADDDEPRLAQRVLEQVELKIYPQVVAWMARGELHCANGQAVYRGQILHEPLELAALEPEFR